MSHVNLIISRQKEVSEREIAKRVLIGIDCTTRFAILTDDYKVIEAYSRMKYNHGSDIELKKLL
jgi:hypothetical protein